MKILPLIKELLKTNLVTTIWFNLKVLPFKQAIRFPFFIYGRFLLRSFDGSVSINSRVIRPGMIKIGKRNWYVSTSIARTIWTVNGDLVFHGTTKFLHGSYLLVARGARLEMGIRGMMGSNVHIIVFDKVILGNDVEIAWDVQIMDTSFHYIESLENGTVSSLTKPIIIGNNVWIGNRCTISKGTILPSYSIVASNSLCNRDFTDNCDCILIAGCPAVVKSTGVRRVFDKTLEKGYDQKYRYDRTHL